MRPDPEPSTEHVRVLFDLGVAELGVSCNRSYGVHRCSIIILRGTHDAFVSQVGLTERVHGFNYVDHRKFTPIFKLLCQEPVC